MTTALIGLCNNVEQHLHKIRVWSASFLKVRPTGTVYLLCANATPIELKKVGDLGVVAIPCTIDNTWFINHQRLKRTYELLDTIDEEFCLVTDVFDVVFQRDPFIDLPIGGAKVFVGGEGVTVGQEPWNADNISKIFPNHRPTCQNQEVLNSGVIAGFRKSLHDLLYRMYVSCENGSNDHNIKDQAALIVLAATNQIDGLKMMTLDDGWACHCAVAGPTQFFHAWGFDRNIRYGIPKMVNDKVCTANGSPFAIVHQFNRVPQWIAALTQPYAT